MNKHDVVLAIALSIRLRDESMASERDSLLPIAQQICEYGVFSNRQVSKISNGKIHHAVISKISKKSTRTGGSINPKSLEEIRELLFASEKGSVNWDLAKKVIEDGTSMTMISKLTGISKTTMSRKIGSF